MHIDFSRGNLRTWILGVLGSGFFGVAAAMAAVNPDRYLVGSTAGTRVMAWLCTAVFLIPCAALLLFARPMLAKDGLTINEHGINGQIPWHDLAAVGVSYKVNPVPHPANRLILPRQGYALELFPQPGADLTGKLNGLLPVSMPPPRPDLPHDHYHLRLPDLDNIPARVEQAVTTHAPPLWTGIHQREWHPTSPRRPV